VWKTFINLDIMTVEERRRRRFSEAFKKEQVKLIESGELEVKEVSRLYEVKPDNVRRWLKKYGSKKFPPTIVVSSSAEYDRLGDLEKQILSLKQIIGDQQIKLITQSSIIELAEQQLGKGFEKK
jgi:transposase-like protein